MAESTDQLTITLSPKASRRVLAHVSSGEYANAADVVEQSIDALEHGDGFLEDWQIEEVLATLKEIDEDPSQLRTSEQVSATIQAEYARALKAG